MTRNFKIATLDLLQISTLIATRHYYATLDYPTLNILQARLEMGAKGDNWAARRDGRILKRL